MFTQERRAALKRLARWAFALGILTCRPLRRAAAGASIPAKEAAMKLRAPQSEGTVSVEKALQQRRTTRSFQPQPLALDQLSQLLWAAQGITGAQGFKRAAPSAGALYPMDLYAVVGPGSVERVPAGVHHYQPQAHGLSLLSGADLRDRVARACHSQMWMAAAPLDLVITAEYRRITVKYGERGIRYAMMEAGHIAQNIFLQAEALGLKAGIVGAFRDRELLAVLKMPTEHEPLLVMPVGYAAAR